MIFCFENHLHEIHFFSDFFKKKRLFSLFWSISAKLKNIYRRCSYLHVAWRLTLQWYILVQSKDGTRQGGKDYDLLGGFIKHLVIVCVFNLTFQGADQLVLDWNIANYCFLAKCNKHRPLVYSSGVVNDVFI